MELWEKLKKSMKWYGKNCMNTPTLKALHICNSHQRTHKSKIAKEYAFANADKQKGKSTKTQQRI
jgi:hypothetical protein